MENNILIIIFKWVLLSGLGLLLSYMTIRVLSIAVFRSYFEMKKKYLE